MKKINDNILTDRAFSYLNIAKYSGLQALYIMAKKYLSYESINKILVSSNNPTTWIKLADSMTWQMCSIYL